VMLVGRLIFECLGKVPEISGVPSVATCKPTIKPPFNQL